MNTCRVCTEPTMWEVCPQCEFGAEAKERDRQQKLRGLQNFIHAEGYDTYCNMPDWLLAESMLAFFAALKKQTVITKGDR